MPMGPRLWMQPQASQDLLDRGPLQNGRDDLQACWEADGHERLLMAGSCPRAAPDQRRLHSRLPTLEPPDPNSPNVRGWVNYFAVGHSSKCFGFIQDWVAKKVRRHMMRSRKRQGFGWTRWSRQWLYETLGLFNGYRVRSRAPKASPAG